MAPAEQAASGALDTLGEFVRALKPSQPRPDVSGTDLGPVARYPGLARTYWHRDKQMTIEYEGEADYAALLEHYARGFATQGCVQSVQSATPSAETHEYMTGGERITSKIAQLPKGAVSARIETPCNE
jgi:hypothetical protein